jgi:hypothetical protein
VCATVEDRSVEERLIEVREVWLPTASTKTFPMSALIELNRLLLLPISIEVIVGFPPKMAVLINSNVACVRVDELKLTDVRFVVFILTAKSKTAFSGTFWPAASRTPGRGKKFYIFSVEVLVG